VFDRPFPEPLPRWDDAEARGTDLWATEHERRADIVDLSHRVWAHTDATIEGLELDSRGHVPWWNEDVPLFNIMLHCLSDTTRHAGHADILREGLDGAVGVDEDRPSPSGLDEIWKARRETIERAARVAAGSGSEQPVG
jgi:hypothetical protein